MSWLSCSLGSWDVRERAEAWHSPLRRSKGETEVAGGDKEHKMLFDLRGGRRGAVVKVVYALLAVLMGLSLFLVIGGFNLAELFNSSNSTGDAAKPYEEQAARIETKLRKEP